MGGILHGHIALTSCEPAKLTYKKMPSSLAQIQTLLGHSSITLSFWIAGPQKSISSGGPIPCGPIPVISGYSQNESMIDRVDQFLKSPEDIFHYPSANCNISFHFVRGFVFV